MIAKEVPMYYVKEFDRWFVEIDDERHGLHCGDDFVLHVGPHQLPCRIEFGRSWYIITGEVRLSLMEARRYTVTY